MRRQPLEQLDAEIEDFIQRETEERIARGMRPEEARRAARLSFGNAALVREDARAVWRPLWLEQLVQDARYTWRTVRRAPGLALTLVLILAIGIGANTAIFSVFNAALLRQLPVPQPDDLFLVSERAPVPTPQRFSYATFELLRDAMPRDTSVAAMSRVARMQARIANSDVRETVAVQLVSGGYFSAAGVTPSRGRLLAADDDRGPSGAAAVVSDRFWRRRFGASPAVLGADITLNGAHVTVVGIAAAPFAGVWLETPVDVWIPLAMQPEVHYSQNYSADNADLTKSWLGQSRVWWLQLFGRSTNRPQALAALNAAYRGELEAHVPASATAEQRERFLQRFLAADPLDRGLSTLRPRLLTPLGALMAMVALLLLMACADAAALLMARASARRQEIDVRLAIGASRSRIVRQLLTESLVLVAAAGVVGLLLARWSAGLLASQLAGTGNVITRLDAPLDLRVLAFATLVSVVTGLLFGLGPAVSAIRSAGRHQINRRVIGGHAVFQRTLVALQIAVSLCLLVGAALFVGSFRTLSRIALGFEPSHVVSAWINPRLGGYQPGELDPLNARITAAAMQIPGVTSAALAGCGLATGCRSTSDVRIEGYAAAPGEQVRLLENGVSPGYFATVGMRLIAGRDFSPSDRDGAPKVAVINQAAARTYFRDVNPLGRRFGYDSADIEVVGIVDDARVLSVQEAPSPMAFYPLAQRENLAFSLEVRTAADPDRLVVDLQRTLSSAEPNLPIERTTTLADQVDHTIDQERLVAALTTMFGIVALVLSCGGLLGVMSYSVSRRTSEFGLRLALGATRRRLLTAVVGEALIVIGVGLAVGIPAVLLLFEPVSAWLFGEHASALSTLAAASAMLCGVAAWAAIVPAWRAARVDPLIALRAN